jgi:hypothetical protein
VLRACDACGRGDRDEPHSGDGGGGGCCMCGVRMPQWVAVVRRRSCHHRSIVRRVLFPLACLFDEHTHGARRARGLAPQRKRRGKATGTSRQQQQHAAQRAFQRNTTTMRDTATRTIPLDRRMATLSIGTVFFPFCWVVPARDAFAFLCCWRSWGEVGLSLVPATQAASCPSKHSRQAGRQHSNGRGAHRQKTKRGAGEQAVELEWAPQALPACPHCSRAFPWADARRRAAGGTRNSRCLTVLSCHSV